MLTKDTALAFGVVLIGFLQDPARKIAEGEPVAMSVMVALVFAAALTRQLFLQQKSIMEPFQKWSPSLVTPLQVYLLIIFLQMVHSILRYGSLQLTVLGLVFYLAPLFAIAIAYHSFGQFKNTRQFIAIFCIFSFLVALSVLLSFNGVQSEFLGEVGSGLIIYDQGTVLEAHSGLMRSSEIAGWHMGSGICLLIILIVSRYSNYTLLFTALAILLMLAAIVVTGRRKMLFQVVLFISLYLPFVRYYQGRLPIRYILLLSFLIPISWFAFNQLTVIQAESRFDLYLLRGSSVFGDATERFTSLGLGSVTWAINRFGILGGGIGVAAQGAQHLGGALAGGAAEGGVGKIVSELGVVAIFVLIWFIRAIAKHIHHCLRLLSQHSQEQLIMTVGVLTFLVANIPTFVVASQVYGDVFVLGILGLLAGSLFAIPRQVTARLRQQSNPQAVTRAPEQTAT